MIKLVAFDFDKVLIDTETIDEIAKINHTDKEISKITQEAMEGKISFETSIKKRVSLLKGINTNEIKKVLKPIPYTIGAKETVKELKKRGYIIAIITGSFTIITDEVKKELNPDYVFSNILETEDGKLTGKITGPLITHDKIDVLKNLIKDLNISLEECAAIGDGANDLNMVKNVALGISFNGKPILEENADKLINKKDLRMVLDIMTDEEKKTNEETTEESGKIELKIKNYSETLNDLKEQGNNGDNEKEETIDEQPETEEETTKETEETTEDETEEPEEEEESSEEESSEEEPEEEVEQIDYSILNFKQLLECKRTLEDELTELKNIRDKLNDEVKEHKKERDTLNQELKDTLKKALDKRNERDEINKDVQKFKKLRDETNEKLKKVEWSSNKKDILNIQTEIKKIDKTIQTKVLDIRKENELVKRISDLTKQLQQIQENKEQEKEVESLKEESEEHHQQVVELSDKAQNIHEEMIAFFKEIDGIRERADAAHQKFIDQRRNATKEHEKVKAKLTEIKKVNKFMDNEKAKEKKFGDEKVKQTDMAEKEKAEETFQKFKDGKKLTTEEFLLLQKYNIM